MGRSLFQVLTWPPIENGLDPELASFGPFCLTKSKKHAIRAPNRVQRLEALEGTVAELAEWFDAQSGSMHTGRVEERQGCRWQISGSGDDSMTWFLLRIADQGSLIHFVANSFASPRVGRKQIGLDLRSCGRSPGRSPEPIGRVPRLVTEGGLAGLAGAVQLGVDGFALLPQEPCSKLLRSSDEIMAPWQGWRGKLPTSRRWVVGWPNAWEAERFSRLERSLFLPVPSPSCRSKEMPQSISKQHHFTRGCLRRDDVDRGIITAVKGPQSWQGHTVVQLGLRIASTYPPT